jgi:diacylglycerol kinase (ATP)
MWQRGCGWAKLGPTVDIAFIANPTAGRGYTQRFIERFEREARDLDQHIDVLWTKRQGHAVELAREAKQHCDVVCVAGGDGTVHEVVNGLMPDPVPLVVVPGGSGNDFASLFACPTTPHELVEVLRAGQGVRTDVIDCGIRYCANSVGIGFEALVTKQSLGIRNLRGLPLYLTAAARALVRYDCPPMTIELDDETITGERLLVSVGNGVRAGGGFYLTPDARVDDGRIDLCIVSPMGRLRILTLLPRSIPGKHTGNRAVQMRRSREVTLTAERPFHMHIDGEYVGMHTGPIAFRVIDRVLPVLSRPGVPLQYTQPAQPIL